MTWRVPKIWEGGECWIIGGGPSVPRQFNVPERIIREVVHEGRSPAVYSQYMEALHDKHVIGVNVAYMIGEWIDVVFFGDFKFFLAHKFGLAEFPGLKVSCNARVNKKQYDWVKYLAHDKERKKGISLNSRKVSWNGNSGAAAISLAVHMGATRIILLGFDMKLKDDDPVQHWHQLYKGLHPPAGKKGRNKKERALPFPRHLKGFEFIYKDARKRGITIINACPDSAIKEFKKMSVKQLLNGEST